MTKIALVMVCKRPVLGKGKQRLVARLGIGKTQQIASALLACALEDACEWPDPVVIAPAEASDSEWAQALAAVIPSPVIIAPQVAGNLGQRLNALDQTLRAQGMKQFAFIGSDAPGLTTADYLAARVALQHSDVALIPALDGGVVLMANRCAWPDLSTLPWSSGQLGIALKNVCHRAGLSVATLKQNYDVDELHDVMKLPSLLQQDVRPARRALLELVTTLPSFTSLPANNA